jgi:hypothetical protein
MIDGQELIQESPALSNFFGPFPGGTTNYANEREYHLNNEIHERHERGNSVGWEAFLLLIIVSSFSRGLTTESTGDTERREG